MLPTNLMHCHSDLAHRDHKGDYKRREKTEKEKKKKRREGGGESFQNLFLEQNQVAQKQNLINL